MSIDHLHPDALTLYRNLQREVRTAIDRAADGLGEQRVACPASPDDPTTTLDAVLRAAMRSVDHPQLARRLLMVLGEAARNQDAVALFTVERLATFYAAQQCTAMHDANPFGLGLDSGDSDAA
jgi:hypothetical protein